jgi:hypothetical protein
MVIKNITIQNIFILDLIIFSLSIFHYRMSFILVHRGTGATHTSFHQKGGMEGFSWLSWNFSYYILHKPIHGP